MSNTTTAEPETMPSAVDALVAAAAVLSGGAVSSVSEALRIVAAVDPAALEPDELRAYARALGALGENRWLFSAYQNLRDAQQHAVQRRRSAARRGH